MKVESVMYGYYGDDKVVDKGWCAFVVTKGGSRYFVIGDLVDTQFPRATQRLRAMGAVDEYLNALKVLAS